MIQRKQATAFKKKYKLKQITSNNLRNVLGKQGYTIIEFNGVNDNENVVILKSELGIGQYMAQSRCFTYRSDKYRLIFIHEDLTEEESVIALAHEEGHIWNDHMTKDSIIGNDVVQEYEANEFAHYLLMDRMGNRRKKSIILSLCCLVIVIAVCVSMFLLRQHDAETYMEDLYITDTGIKYHIRDCMYIKDKMNVQKLTKEEFYSGVYEPCEACKPDER